MLIDRPVQRVSDVTGKGMISSGALWLELRQFAPVWYRAATWWTARRWRRVLR